MKFCKVSLFLALLVAVYLPAAAQSQIRLNIPFEFSAGGKSLPAGHYTVARVDESDLATWRISNSQSAVIVLTNSLESPNKAHPPSLVFLCAGDRYFLLQIWASEHSGQALLLKPKVTTIILAQGSKVVEVGAE